MNHSRHSSGKPFVELLEVLWSDGALDHSCHFLDSFTLLHLNLKPQIDFTNYKKIGDINEALLICKQSTQTASVYLNAFRSNSKKFKIKSGKSEIEIFHSKLNNF